MLPATSSFGILNNLDCAYFEVDFKGNMINANQAFLNKAELTLEQMIGKHYRHMVDPRQVTDLYNTFNVIYRTRELRRILFNFIQHKSGGIRTAEGITGPILTPNGEIIGFRGILFDVTERIKDEMEILSAKQAAENELAIGRKIQHSFLPATLPQVEGWQMDVRFHSARDVAGDFYDIFPMSNGARLGIVVADVCDKGVGAAMYMAIFRTLLRAFANINTPTNLTKAMEVGRDPDQTDSMFIRKQNILSVGAQPLMNAIEMTNQYIVQNHGNSNMFATVFFAVLNPQDGKILFINAGHEPPLIISGGKITRRLEPTGPAVGLMEGMQFNIGETELSPGDLLFAYTDGVVDARDANGKSFTEERMLQEISQSADSPNRVIKQIISSLHNHISDQDQYDDITLLGLYRK
jgi:sigma-B regulation protein RsbU (phosphoserine phosphatase)